MDVCGVASFITIDELVVVVMAHDLGTVGTFDPNLELQL